jgi:segregation and condensation protein A
MSTARVKLDVFEGPLDLLLHLIKKSEVQIVDVQISSITDQYLAALEAHPELLNLDGAGEYLVMAATLTFIKSRMLLPQAGDDGEDGEDDPRAELVQQLLEYQRYREVAVALGSRAILERDVFAHPTDPVPPAAADAPDEPTVRGADLGDLLEALRGLLAKRTPPRAHEIDRPHRSVAQSVHEILSRFTAVDRIEFTSLFPDDADRADIIALFLALLELVKLHVVGAMQDDRFGPIHLRLAVASVAEAVSMVRDVGREAWGGEAQDGNGINRSS